MQYNSTRFPRILVPGSAPYPLDHMSLRYWYLWYKLICWWSHHLSRIAWNHRAKKPAYCVWTSSSWRNLMANYQTKRKGNLMFNNFLNICKSPWSLCCVWCRFESKPDMLDLAQELNIPIGARPSLGWVRIFLLDQARLNLVYFYHMAI